MAQGSRLAWLLLLALPACGGEPPAAAPPIPPPERSAAADRDVRALLEDVAAARACEGLEGRFVGLAEGSSGAGRPGSAPTLGRLLVERCAAAPRAGGGLDLHLEGRGWTWVDEAGAGPLATRFAVRGMLRFGLALDMPVDLDLGYDRQARLATLWLTPREAPRAAVTPTGPLPVQAEGSWSGLVGRIGEILGGSPADRAGPLLQAQAGALIAGRLRSGVTATVDLCTGQPDVVVGALGGGERPDRPFSADGRPWLDNERVLLRPGGLDVSGPYATAGGRLEVELEVEEGPGVEARVLCIDAARAVANAYLESRPAAPVAARARQWVDGPGRATLAADGAGCDLALLLTPRAEPDEPTRLRVRVRQAGSSVTPLARCE